MREEAVVPEPGRTARGQSASTRATVRSNDLEFMRAAARRAEAEARLAETLAAREQKLAADAAWAARQERKAQDQQRLDRLYSERKRRTHGQ